MIILRLINNNNNKYIQKINFYSNSLFLNIPYLMDYVYYNDLKIFNIGQLIIKIITLINCEYITINN